MVEFPPISPKMGCELFGKTSRIFDSYRDKVLKLKKDENKLGIYSENFHETTIDWVLLLKESHVEIYKVEGLRNFPCRSIKVTLYNKLKLHNNPVMKLSRLIKILNRKTFKE
jgi:hypothetical protein